MEGITRLVSESLARHGFDRPLDYRRLHWSRWFRCESHHSLLFIPSKPGVFALAEEIMDVDMDCTNAHVATARVATAHVATAAKPALSGVEGAVPRSEASGPVWDRVSDPVRPSEARRDLVATTSTPRRMLAVTQFFEDDDMAFVLDRMLSRQNPMAARLASGRYFVRFVVIEDQTQRRSICNALNQWIVSTAEKATGIGSHFASSLELTPATEYVPQTNNAQATLFDDGSNDGNVARAPSPTTVGGTDTYVAMGASPVPRSEASGSGATLTSSSPTTPQLDSGAATNIHCPSPFPSGF